MYCEHFNCTLSVETCIKRQTINSKSPVTLTHAGSFEICQKCTHGKEVLKNPKRFINRDFTRLIMKQMKGINTNGKK